MLNWIARDQIGRRHGVLRNFVAGVALSAGLIIAPQQAAALEIFGFKLFGNDDPADDIVDPVNYVLNMNLEGVDESIRSDIEKASTLTADKDRPVSGSLGILSKARNERELLVAALYQQARYDGTVEITVEGRSLDELEPDATFDVSRPVPVVVTVTSGQEFTIGEVTVTGETADIAPAKFGLMPGGDASSSAILRAENQMVLALKDEGRPLANVLEREVIADHKTGTLDVMIALEAGPVAPFGDTTVDGTETVDADFTEYMADIERGKIYSPDDVRDARERLLALGVFSSVTVKEKDALAADGSIPIDIQVSERKHRYFGLGATVSSTDGAGVEGYWGHRNLFGRAERLRLEGSISRIGEARDFKDLDYKAALLFEKPGVIGPASKFTFDIKFANEHPDAYDRFVFSAGAGVSYNLTKRQTLSGQVRVEYSDVSDVFNPLGKKYLLVSTPIEYIFDARDDKLNPKSGYRLLANVEPTYDALSGAAFVKVRGEASAYKSIDESGRFVLAGRVAAGTIAGARLSDVPADRRFYSGGGGSVRGYSYQGIGPRIPDPVTGKLVPTGGLSYAEASVEMRIQITDTLGIVPFLDAGTVSERMMPDFGDMRYGAGIGFRYLTPFGPLRVDAAVPLDRRPGDAAFGIYAGIGQAF
jgi:translocation and assembly module TamA